MSETPKNIRQALAQLVDQKDRDILLAESLGKGNTSEVSTWRFQSKNWKEVLKNSAGQKKSN